MESTLSRAPAADALSIQQRHARRFAVLTWIAIGVSYVHQAGSLLLFSGDGYPDVAATLGMIAIVDLSLWMLGEYLYEARRAGRKAGWALLTFVLATVVSVGLNFVYLFTHKPAESVLNWYLSVTIAATFALFVPLLIAISGRIRADLARWELESGAEQHSLTQATSEARQARAQLADLESQLQAARADLETTRAQATAVHGKGMAWERQATTAEQRAADLARLATEHEQRATAERARSTELERTSAEQARQLAEHTRLATEQQRRADDLARRLAAAQQQATDLEHAATALPTRQTVAARLKAELGRMSVAELARATGWKESTLRDMVAAA